METHTSPFPPSSNVQITPQPHSHTYCMYPDILSCRKWSSAPANENPCSCEGRKTAFTGLPRSSPCHSHAAKQWTCPQRWCYCCCIELYELYENCKYSKQNNCCWWLHKQFVIVNMDADDIAMCARAYTSGMAHGCITDLQKVPRRETEWLQVSMLLDDLFLGRFRNS